MGKSFEEMSREELIDFAERALKAGLEATAYAKLLMPLAMPSEHQPSQPRKSWRQLLFGT